MSDEKQVVQDDEVEATSEQTGGEEPAGGENARTITLTQEELDRLISARVKRAERQGEEKARREREREEMSELERLRADLQTQKQIAEEARRNAAAALTRARAERLALTHGVRPDRLDYAIRMLDLDQIEPDEDGSVPQAAIDAAVQQLVKQVPELLGKTSTAAGGDFSGGAEFRDPATMTMDEYIRWRNSNA